MKNRNALRSSIVASLILAPAVPLLAAEDPALRVKLQEPEPPTRNRFGVSYRAGFNITAQFKTVGGGSRANPGPATGSGINRTYDDGYNKVDSQNGQDGFTWNWAYKNPSQIPGNDTVVMHSTFAQASASKTIDSDPEHGFEVTYNRELGRIGKNKNLPWGLEVGFGWTDIQINDHRPLNNRFGNIADAYGLEGIDPSHNIIPPGQTTPAPYSEGGSQFNPGTKDGPGPIIEDSPSRTTTFNSQLVTGSRRFEADLFSFRLGPYIDIPIDDKWSLSLSAGFAVGLIDGEFSFNELTTSGDSSTRLVGAGGNTDVVFGGYVSAGIHYAINEHWGVFITGQYMGLTPYSATANGQKVEIDLARTAFISLGVTYSF